MTRTHFGSASGALLALFAATALEAQGTGAVPISVCVLEDGNLQAVTALYDRATGDTTVAGEPFSRAYPSGSSRYAGAQPWYVHNDPIAIDGSYYVKYGLPRVLGITEVVAIGAYESVRVFAESGTTTPAEVTYLPVRAGCEFQPYQIVPGVVGEVRIGQTVRGSLGAEDEGLEAWYFHGRRGDRIRVSLESDDFDPYLMLAGFDAMETAPLAEDDDGGDGLDARLDHVLESDGLHAILVSSYDEEEIGDYTLATEASDAAVALWSGSGDAPGIRAGETVTGTLSESDPMASDDSYYDDYAYVAEAGEMVVVELRSASVDTYLMVGRDDGAGFEGIDSDDDGAGGTDSRLEIVFPAAGAYVIRAGSLFEEEVGEYTLLVRPFGQ